MTVNRITCLCVLLAASAFAQTSNVQTVKGWKRTYVIGLPDGTILEPTGRIGQQQRVAAAQAALAQSSNLVSAAHDGLTNALQRLYAAAPQTNRFTGRIYIAADMDNDPVYSNVWGAVVGESASSDGTLHYFCHYSHTLAVPPKTTWGFALDASTTAWAPGDAGTNNVLTNVNGYACYDIKVAKPSAVGNVVLRTNKFIGFGAPGTPLDIDEAGLSIIRSGRTNDTFTGAVSYAEGTNTITETYRSGFLFNVATNGAAQ